jgi:hypothetical protein
MSEDFIKMFGDQLLSQVQTALAKKYDTDTKIILPVKYPQKGVLHHHLNGTTSDIELEPLYDSEAQKQLGFGGCCSCGQTFFGLA